MSFHHITFSNIKQKKSTVLQTLLNMQQMTCQLTVAGCHSNATRFPTCEFSASTAVRTATVRAVL